MRRIAYICADPGVPVFGCKGSSVHVQEIVRAMARTGAQVMLFARKFGGAVPPGLEDVECLGLPGVQEKEPAQREQALIQSNALIAEFLERHGPFDMVYERYALWSDAAMRWARRKGIASVLEVNAPLIEEQAKHRGLHDCGAAERIAASVFADADTVIGVSSGVGSYLADRGVAADKVRIIPNGVSVGRFDPAPRPRDGALVVGFVGTLKPWHGVDTLITAVRMARERGVPARLLIVGDGPERARIQTQLDQAGLADITELTGAVAPGDIAPLIARMDVAMAPYPDLPDFYFSPLKIMEYMAAGRATIASRIGDIDGLITHGEDGLLCPPGHAAAISEALVRLHRDPDLRERLGRAARAKAAAEMGWDSVVARIFARTRELAPC